MKAIIVDGTVELITSGEDIEVKEIPEGVVFSTGSTSHFGEFTRDEQVTWGNGTIHRAVELTALCGQRSHSVPTNRLKRATCRNCTYALTKMLREVNNP